MSQTSYTTEHRLGIPGQEAELLPSKKGHAKNAEAVAIPFGVAVARSANSDVDRVLPASASAEIMGVALQSYWAENRDLSNDDGIAAGEYFNEMLEGTIWVKPEVNVQPGEPVYVRHTANGLLTQLGAFRNDGDPVATVDTALQIRGRWRSVANAGEPALLEVFNPLT